MHTTKYEPTRQFDVTGDVYLYTVMDQSNLEEVSLRLNLEADRFSHRPEFEAISFEHDPWDVLIASPERRNGERVARKHSDQD